MAETFGQWLKRTREKQRLTQETLADRAGVTKQYVSNIERDTPHGITGARPSPKMKVVKDLATGLQVPESEALRAAGYYPDEPETDPRQAQLLSYFRELSDNERDDALALIETVYRRRERVRKVAVVSPTKGIRPDERPARKIRKHK